jgi:hypothetical protein
MTIETKYNKGDAVKCWDNSLGWRYGNIQKIKITIICPIPDIQYVVDFSDEINPKDIGEMKEYQLLRIEEDGY